MTAVLPATEFDDSAFAGPSDLVVRHANLSYSGVRAVCDVSFGVRQGELVGLIGPNGAGKTSLVDAVTGYARNATGEVVLGGRRLDGVRAHRRARAGLVRTFQGLEIFNDLTVEENVEVALRANGTRGRADGPLRLLGLEPVADHLAGSLPQGERRMLALARAVACAPKVLVLDEPAAGLDTGESKQLGVRLQGLVDSGLGILLIDHDMSLVLAVCHRILVLDHGELIAVGDPEAIRNDERVRQAYLGG
jgi:ABC-type branched-subunit amino acid transport system ATPase component